MGKPAKAASKQRTDRYPDMASIATGRMDPIAALAMGRKRISGFDMEIGVSWKTWGFYGRLLKWLISVRGCIQFSEIPQPVYRLAPILYMIADVTILGLYIHIELHNIGKIKVGTGTTVPPCLLKDAIFARASMKSGFYCWIKTSDGWTYAMTSHETFRLSNRGGKGPIRFRKWLVEQDSEKWAGCKDYDQQTIIHQTGSGNDGKDSKSEQIH